MKPSRVGYRLHFSARSRRRAKRLIGASSRGTASGNAATGIHPFGEGISGTAALVSLQRLSPEPDPPPPRVFGAEKSPRFTFLPPDRILLVHIGSLVGFIRDISAGGLSFHMEIPLTVGRKIEVNIDQKFRGWVNVLNNTLDESTDSDTYGMYRTGTKFLNENDGYRCMVRTLKLSSQLPRF